MDRCQACGRNPVTTNHADPACEECGRAICLDCIATVDEDTGRIGCTDCYRVFIRWLRRMVRTGQNMGEG